MEGFKQLNLTFTDEIHSYLLSLKKKKKSKTWEEFFLTSVKEKNKLFVPKIENNIPEEIGEEIVNG